MHACMHAYTHVQIATLGRGHKGSHSREAHTAERLTQSPHNVHAHAAIAYALTEATHRMHVLLAHGCQLQVESAHVHPMHT